LANYTWQGQSVNSTWSRGQAWGIYGFAQAYDATGNPAFLTEAEEIATYFIRNLPSDDVPYWDFSATPGPTTPRDTSAAAVAADGLLMLSGLATTAGQRDTYLTWGGTILGSLTASYLAPSTGEAVLTDGSGDVPAGSEVDTELILGDYYFTEAIDRLQDVYNRKPDWSLYGGGPLVASPLTEVVRTAAFTPIGGSPVPEPSSTLIFGGSLLALALRWRRAARQPARMREAAG
jgi:hypothetical protein